MNLDNAHCHKCGCELTPDNQYGGSNIICKECHNKACREYRQKKRKNGDSSYIESEKVRGKHYYWTVGQRLRDTYLNQFKTPCIHCGEKRLPAIVFHHIEPTAKRFCVGGGTYGKHSDAEMREEIAKCVCLCENCHREFHHIYGHQIENAKQKLEIYIGKSLKEAKIS